MIVFTPPQKQPAFAVEIMKTKRARKAKASEAERRKKIILTSWTRLSVRIVGERGCLVLAQMWTDDVFVARLDIGPRYSSKSI
jgi:hypothetical protein